VGFLESSLPRRRSPWRSRQRRRGRHSNNSMAAEAWNPLEIGRLKASEQIPEAQLPDFERSLANDGPAHLRLAFRSLCEHDGNLDESKSCPPRSILHFELKGVAVRLHAVQIDRFENATMIADEAGSYVVNRQACDGACIYAGAIGKHEPGKRPVDHSHPIHVSRSNRHISLILLDGVDEQNKVRWVV